MTTYYMHTYYLHNDALTTLPDCAVDGCDPRPVVVIDPEDREMVERLSKAMHESDHIAPWHDLHAETRGQIERAMQAALRSHIAPPRPEEPQGLGAVVEDEDGDKWVRTTDAEHSPAPWLTKTGERWSDYAGIAVVEVHNEGVTR